MAASLVKSRQVRNQTIKFSVSSKQIAFTLTGLLFASVLSLSSLSVQAQCGSGATVNVGESRCEATGSVEILSASGAGPFTYDFISYPVDYVYTGPTSSNVLTGLNPGNYTVRVVDQGAGNCFSDYNFTVTGNYLQPTYTVTPSSVSNCSNGSNGSLSGVLVNGRTPNQYTILAGPMGIGSTNGTGTFSNLVAGTYTVRGEDSCGNFQTRQATIANFSWTFTVVNGSKTNCNQYSLDGVTHTAGMSGMTYGIIRGAGDTLIAGSFPFAFTCPDAQIASALGFAKDSCGNIATLPFAITNNTSFSVSSSSFQKINCPIEYSLNSVNITGSPFLPLTYGVVKAAGDTVWSATLPITYNQVGTNNVRAVVKDACGVMQFGSSQNMRLRFTSVSRSYTSCTLANLTVTPSGNTTYIGSLSYTLNPGAVTQATTTFTDLVDGTYTVTVTDGCGTTSTSSVVISHSWTSSVNVENACGANALRNFVAIPQRAIGPVKVVQYQGGTPLDSVTVSKTGNANQSSSAAASYVSFYNTTPGSSYTYIITDTCGLTQTLNITNPAQGHQPNSMTGSVIPLCVNKGNVVFNYQSDLPNSFPALLSMWNIQTPGTLIVNNVNTGTVSGTYTKTDLNSGTYVLRYVPLNCASEISLDTVTVDPYAPTSLRKSIAFNCAAINVNVVAVASGGVPPYQYEIFQTFPTNNPQSNQSSPVFTLSGTYSLVRLRVTDACGNSSLQDVAVRPAARPMVRLLQRFPVCNLNTLAAYVDSIYPAATYQWRTPAGVQFATTPSINIPVTSADTGLYTCRITIPGTCYVDTALLRLRPKDFGCYAQIGNRVWNDQNQNGLQDNNEVGVAGVAVTLYDVSNAIKGATLTDANGNYLFEGLIAGDYKVGVTIPVNYVFSSQNTGGDDLIDSDIDPTSGLTSYYSLIIGDSNMSADAGIYQPSPSTASLGDRVWNDLNQNGLQDPNEFGVAGVEVTLYGSDGVTALGNQLTDAFGNYMFTGLTAGTYKVGFSNLPTGFSFTSSNSGNDELDSDADTGTGKTGFYTLTSGQDNITVDAGLVQSGLLASLGNYVWNDINEDGVQDPNEPGVQGVNVTLYNTAGTPLSTTLTNNAGLYNFDGLNPGTYYVEFSNLPTGFQFTGMLAGGNSALDSDADPVNGSTAWVTLSAGQNYIDLDAGISTRKAGLGNYVWNDDNNNGLQDPGEQGLAGITVTLYAANGTTEVANTVTNASGLYTFVNLIPNTYVVGFSGLPAGALLSPSNVGANDSLDSDADQITGKTTSVTLAAEQYNPTLDAGIKPCTVDGGATKTINCLISSAVIGTPSYTGATYSWSPSTGLSSATIAMPTASPLVTTTYTVTVNGACTDTVTVIVDTAAPVANAGLDKQLFCNSTSTSIGTVALVGNTYSWLPVTGLSSSVIAVPTATMTSSQTYTVTVTGANGCTATDAVAVNYSNSLTTLDITAFPNNKFCYGSNIQLQVIGQSGASFNWNAPVGCAHSIDSSISGKSILTINDLQSSCNGVFSVSQGIAGCASSSPSNITVDGGPVPTINFVTTLCVSNTGQVTVNASSASPLEYAINGGSFQGSNVMTTLQGSTFVVAVKSQNSSCIQHYVGECVYCVPIGSCATPSKDSMVVPNLACIGVAIPVVNYLTNATMATFTTTGTGTFDVSSCNTSPCTVNYTPSAADYINGSVILTAVTDDQDGVGPCQAARTSKLIKLANELVAPTIVSNSPVCENSLLNFEAIGSIGKVNWTGNGGFTSNLTEVIIANAPATLHGNLTATVSGYGCTNKSSTKNIVVVSQPNLNVNINAIPEFCLGSANGAIQVGVTGGSGTYTICYSGNLGNCVTGTTANFQWIAPGNYTVTVVDAICPGNTFSYPVTILPGTLVPTPTVAPTFTACAGENLLLSGTTSVPNSSINWSYQANNFNANGLSVTRYAATPSMSGTYYAKTIDLNGCASNSIPVNVIVEPKPLITHVQINCVGAASTVVITASLSGATLEYSLDGISYQSSNTFLNVPHGNYLLHVKDVNGTCPATFYAYVPNCLCPNEPVVSVNNPKVSCGLTPIPLTGTFTNVANATWSTSGTGTFSVAGGSSPTSTVYTPSAADLASGLIYIYLITDDPDGAGPCTPVSRSEPIIMVDSLQIPSITKNQPSYCSGDTVIMTANGVSTPVEWFGVGGFYTDSVVAVLPNATQFLSGKYIVRASGNGCVTKADSVILSIAAPPALVVSTTSVNEGCFGHANGEITVNVTGGSGNYIVCNDLGINCTNTTGQYTFKWLAPATYTIYAADAQCPNARFTAIDTINAGLEVAPPTTATYNDTVCEGEDLILTATGPIGSTYLWTDLKNNFTEYGETITRANAKTDMTGRFKVQRIESGCASADKYLDVKVFGIPTILTADTLCVGGDSGRITVNALVAGGDTIEYAINDELYQPSNVFNYLPNGMYQVKARNKGSDCETIFTNIELYCLCVCNKEANVSVFPNPNSGNFTVNANLVVPSNNIVVSVFDFSGRTIFEKPMEAPTGVLNYNIDISTYSAGAYMVRVLIDGERFLIPIQVVGKK